LPWQQNKTKRTRTNQAYSNSQIRNNFILINYTHTWVQAFDLYYV